jgi:hypothetical protein
MIYRVSLLFSILLVCANCVGTTILDQEEADKHGLLYTPPLYTVPLRPKPTPMKEREAIIEELKEDYEKGNLLLIDHNNNIKINN